MKSSHTEAANEMVTEESDERAAAAMADTKTPVSPGTADSTC